VKVRTRKKSAAARDKKRKKTAIARHYQRLRRQIWFTNRRVTRMVHDMHQKVTDWLASNYQCVLLPTFQTSKIVRLYEKEEAADGTPETSADERTLLVQAHPIDRVFDMQNQASLSAPTIELPTIRSRCQKRDRVIRSSMAWATLTQAHYKFESCSSTRCSALEDA
jgi:transposase